MSDINALEARIAAALERLQRGVANLSERSDGVETGAGDATDPETLAALQARVEEERTANAQLEERVRALKERQDQKLAVLEERVAAQKAEMIDLDARLQRLQAANAELRGVASEMRSALIDELADPDLVNRALLAELEALQATQSADRAEIDAILGTLLPIVEEA